MPPERKSVTVRLDINDFTLYATVGLYANGVPGEIFLRANQVGTVERGLLHALGLMISLALQHGVPLATIVDRFKDIRFEPAGLTKNPEFPTAASILDYLAKWMEERFLKEKVAC